MCWAGGHRAHIYNVYTPNNNAHGFPMADSIFMVFYSLCVYNRHTLMEYNQIKKQNFYIVYRNGIAHLYHT